MKISDVSTWPTSSGKSHYQRYLKGEKLTQRQAILAKCCDCNCGWIDGRYSCEMEDCPLFTWMPYRKKRPVVASEDNEGTDEGQQDAEDQSFASTGSWGAVYRIAGANTGKEQVGF